MTKIKFFLLGACFAYSLTSFADSAKVINCKNSQGFGEIKQKILSIDKTFQWDNANCKMVGIQSLFPKKNDNGVVKFEKGLQVFVYDNDQLKFICLPGWVCNSWKIE
jgi:hypothetical protein